PVAVPVTTIIVAAAFVGAIAVIIGVGAVARGIAELLAAIARSGLLGALPVLAHPAGSPIFAARDPRRRRANLFDPARCCLPGGGRAFSPLHLPARLAVDTLGAPLDSLRLPLHAAFDTLGAVLRLAFHTVAVAPAIAILRGGGGGQGSHGECGCQCGEAAAFHQEFEGHSVVSRSQRAAEWGRRYNLLRLLIESV